LPFTLKEIAINDGWQSGLSAIVDNDRLSPLIKAAFLHWRCEHRIWI